MKRKLLFLITLLFMLYSLSACSNIGIKEATLSGRMQIPEDGIITSAFLQQMHDSNTIITFEGQSNGFRYEWTVFGSDINICNDIDLRIEIIAVSDESVSFKYCSKNDFGFSPVLSIYLDRDWDVLSSLLYDSLDAEHPLCTVGVTGKKSILNFAASSQSGERLIIAERISEESDTCASVDNNLTDRPVSDGSRVEKDAYLTDPVPIGKPLPVEPQDQVVNNKKQLFCTFSIECATILNNLSELDPDKLDEVPSDGIIFPPQKVSFSEGESVYEVLQRICKENGIHMEASWTPIYNSAYVEGIHNLYEFDCGSGSGWMYRVDGWYPNYGCSRYILADGENVEWRYTCDLGSDVGGAYAIGE